MSFMKTTSNVHAMNITAKIDMWKVVGSEKDSVVDPGMEVVDEGK